MSLGHSHPIVVLALLCPKTQSSHYCTSCVMSLGHIAALFYLGNSHSITVRTIWCPYDKLIQLPYWLYHIPQTYLWHYSTNCIMSLGHIQTILYSLCHVPSTHSSHYFNYYIMSLWHIHPITVIALLTFFLQFFIPWTPVWPQGDPDRRTTNSMSCRDRRSVSGRPHRRICQIWHCRKPSGWAILALWCPTCIV